MSIEIFEVGSLTSHEKGEIEAEMDAHNIRTCPWAQQGESGAVPLPPLEPCRAAFHDILCPNSLPIELQDPASQSSTKPSHGLGASDRATGIARHVWHCGQMDTQRTP